tara:strand:- start:224 stop:601 length:378 start_codon:yes stop_codon:yes gene_type:complete
MKALIIILLFVNYSFSQTDSIYSNVDKKAEIINENYALWHQTYVKYANKWIKHDVRFENDSVKIICVVEKNGKLSDCNVVYSTNENLTKLMLIVNYKHIYWNPAEKDNKSVRSRQEIVMIVPEGR